MATPLEKLPLFSGKREGVAVFLAALLLLGVHLGWHYRKYLVFVDRPFYYTWGEIIRIFPKSPSQKRGYRLLKIRTDDGWKFYTGTYRDIDGEKRRVRLQIFPSSRISFIDYLRTPYIPSRIKKTVKAKESLHTELADAVARQHTDPEAAAFFKSIYLADPLPPGLREKISSLGGSHLVALSGFHLGILWGVLFLLMRPLYRRIQSWKFPWRYDLIDLGSVTLALLGTYLWLTGFPPSLLRSYAMLLTGWAALLLGIELLSFPFLAVVTAGLLVLHPPLLFSLGFWLSVGGVFYIYLLLEILKDFRGWTVKLLLLPFGIHLLMLPVAHAFFPTLSPWQWLSPVLSVLFTLFYPFSFLLHLLGLGGILDGILTALWNLPGESLHKTLPFWTLPPYLLLSLLAVRSRMALYGVFLFASGAAVFLYSAP